MSSYIKYGLTIAALASAVVYVFSFRPQEVQSPSKKEIQEAAPVAKTTVNEAQIDYQYSRVTFFNTRPVRASLAVPSHWEGQYRLKERGNEAAFYYIGGGKELPLLSFFLVKEGATEGLDTNRLPAGQKDGYLVFYRLFTPDTGQNGPNEPALAVYKDSRMVVDSLKLR